MWVIEGGRLARRAVTLGRRDEAGARVEVLEGITAQTRVLGARFDNLREGAQALISGRPPVITSTASTASAPALR